MLPFFTELILSPVEVTTVQPSERVPEIEFLDQTWGPIDVETELSFDFSSEQEKFDIRSTFSVDRSRWHMFIYAGEEELKFTGRQMQLYERFESDDIHVGFARDIGYGEISVGLLSREEGWGDRVFSYNERREFVTIGFTKIR